MVSSFTEKSFTMENKLVKLRLGNRGGVGVKMKCFF